jgi:hypothetical protein
LQFRLSTLLLLPLLVAIPLGISSSRSLPIGDVFGSLVIAAGHSVWWWLVLPRHCKDGRTATLARLCYIALVICAVFPFNNLFPANVQPFAFAGLVASALHAPNLKKLEPIEKYSCYYSIVINLIVLLSGYLFREDDPLFFSQCWLLASAVVHWIHVRLKAIRPNPIYWMLGLSSFLYWLGMFAAISGLAAYPLFIAGGVAVLFYSLVLLVMGIYGSLAVSVAVWLELFSTPSPRMGRICYGYGICLTWVLLNATLGLVR